MTKFETHEPIDLHYEDDADFNQFMNFIKAPSPEQSPVESPPAPVVRKVATAKAVPVMEADGDEDFGDFLEVLKTDSHKTSKKTVTKAAPVKKVAPAYVKALNATAEASIAAPVKKVKAPKAAVVKAAPIAVPVTIAASKDIDTISETEESTATTETPIAMPTKITTKKPELAKTMSKADIAASNAVSQIELHDETPIAVQYFTKMAAEEAARNKVEMRELALKNMPAGSKYFDKLAYEAEVKRCAEIEEMIRARRPEAVEYFTAKDLAAKEKKRREIQALRDNPPPMSEGQAYFTNKMRGEHERQQKEIQDMIDNPPPASVATEYFKIKEIERQVEIEKLLNAPAPVAIQYFIEKAKEDEARNKEVMQRSMATAGEVSAATKHFVDMEKQKSIRIEAARAEAKKSEPMEALPVDYFAKQSSAYLTAKAQVSKDLADSLMPIGVRYFTKLGEVEKAQKYEERRLLSEASMSHATKHFKKIDEEKMAASLSEETDMMPAAIQKFTMEANAIRDAKKAEIQAMYDNPPPMPEGQAYFTNKMRAELERQRSEIQAMIDNPPPASVANQHFKGKEAERQKEIEKLMKEPAPPAIAYFTKMAEEEAQRNKEAMARSMATNGETSAAVKHFEELEKKKALGIEAARDATRTKTPMESVPIDYFTKLGNEEMAAKAAAKKKFSESQMPQGVKFFTAKAEAEKAANAGVPEHEHAALATKYFNKKANEDAKKASAESQGDMMPAAIQKFTMQARMDSMRKKAILEEMNRNPPAPAPGIVHFTPGLQ